jgi:hypothetical protein
MTKIVIILVAVILIGMVVGCTTKQDISPAVIDLAIANNSTDMSNTTKTVNVTSVVKATPTPTHTPTLTYPTYIPLEPPPILQPAQPLNQAPIVTPVPDQPMQQHKQVNTIYVWTNGTPNAQLNQTIRELSQQYKVEVHQYAGDNMARFIFDVKSAPAITVMYSMESSQHVDAFNLYGSQIDYSYIQYRIDGEK